MHWLNQSGLVKAISLTTRLGVVTHGVDMVLIEDWFAGLCTTFLALKKFLHVPCATVEDSFNERAAAPVSAGNEKLSVATIGMCCDRIGTFPAVITPKFFTGNRINSGQVWLVSIAKNDNLVNTIHSRNRRTSPRDVADGFGLPKFVTGGFVKGNDACLC